MIVIKFLLIFFVFLINSNAKSIDSKINQYNSKSLECIKIIEREKKLNPTNKIQILDCLYSLQEISNYLKKENYYTYERKLKYLIKKVEDGSITHPSHAPSVGKTPNEPFAYLLSKINHINKKIKWKKRKPYNYKVENQECGNLWTQIIVKIESDDSKSTTEMMKFWGPYIGKIEEAEKLMKQCREYIYLKFHDKNGGPKKKVYYKWKWDKKSESYKKKIFKLNYSKTIDLLATIYRDMRSNTNPTMSELANRLVLITKSDKYKAPSHWNLGVLYQRNKLFRTAAIQFALAYEYDKKEKDKQDDLAQLKIICEDLQLPQFSKDFDFINMITEKIEYQKEQKILKALRRLNDVHINFCKFNNTSLKNLKFPITSFKGSKGYTLTFAIKAWEILSIKNNHIRVKPKLIIYDTMKAIDKNPEDIKELDFDIKINDLEDLEKICDLLKKRIQSYNPQK